MKLKAELAAMSNGGKIKAVITALLTLCVCISLAVITVVFSPSILEKNYQTDMPQEYGMDSETSRKYNNAYLNFMADGNTDKLEEFTGKLNGDEVKLFSTDDIDLLVNVRTGVISVIVCLAVSAVLLLIILLQTAASGGKKAVSQLGVASLTFFIALLIITCIATALISIDFAGFSKWALGIIGGSAYTAYQGGSLAFTVGAGLGRMFKAWCINGAIFAVVSALVLYWLSRRGKPRAADFSDNYMYQ